jgi:hypothetical protein
VGANSNFSSGSIPGDIVIRNTNTSNNIFNAIRMSPITQIGSTGMKVTGFLTINNNFNMQRPPGYYNNISMSGGNSTGYIYGNYDALGDGIHLGYFLLSQWPTWNNSSIYSWNKCKYI